MRIWLLLAWLFLSGGVHGENGQAQGIAAAAPGAASFFERISGVC